MEQTSLFENNPKKRKLSIDERFDIWTKENTVIVGLYLKFARAAKASGREYYGIAAITERIRWEVNIDSKDPNSDFKISNDYRAPMARLLVKLDPQLAGFFSMKKRPSLAKKTEKK
jgi:hypothetical protein